MKYLFRINKINVIKYNLLNYYMDISNNQPNVYESTSNDSETNNDFSNIDNILEGYITSILTNQPLEPPSLSETPEQNLLPSPPSIPPVQLTPFSGTPPLELDPMFRFVNQLFSVPINRHPGYVVPFNPGDNILIQSFNEKPIYKNVLSEKGEQQLKEIKFSESDKTNDTCPIFQMSFDDDDMVAQLPCKHIFTPDGIRKWLSEEQAICPVCRYKLDSNEVKIKNEDDHDTESEMHGLVDDDDEEPSRNISRSRIALIRSLANLANNTHISRRTTGFSMLDQEEEDDLQAAIYASLQTNESSSDTDD